jgi:periplasmic divalent cation tolerance protein
VTSIYRWQGAVVEDRETILILKTRAERVEKLTAHLRGLHSYETPCIAAVPIIGGDPAYLDWIAAETE